MKYGLIGLVGAVLTLWLALYLFEGGTITGEGKLKFDNELTLSYRILSEGGALGAEHYEVFADQQGERHKIFDGSGASDFALHKAGPDLILLRFCGGIVEHLSPIGATEGRGRIIVQPVLYCKA